MPRRRIQVEHDIKDVVYLSTDINRLPRIVTAITIYPTGIQYRLACGPIEDSWHYDFEIITKLPQPQIGFESPKEK